jgi:hypothetical protein
VTNATQDTAVVPNRRSSGDPHGPRAGFGIYGGGESGEFRSAGRVQEDRDPSRAMT